MRRLALCLALATAIAPAATGAQSTSEHFMWEVRQADGPPTYLVGSLHVLTPEYYPLDPVFDKAFSASKVLLEEVNLDELTNPATAVAMAGKAMLTDGRLLSELISPELYQQVVARGEKAGLPPAALQRMKPWMVAVMLTVPALKEAGFDAALGVDKYFFDKAKKAGMEIRALETVAYQFDRLDQMSPAMQEAMLKSVLADIEREIANTKIIARAWSQGEVATMEKELLSAVKESPELYERLLVERNKNWVAPVERCLQEKTRCFLVVGAAHLVGPHSLVALLRAKGYSVNQQ
jgi:uncharacterized protein YbaP (TraB family)